MLRIFLAFGISKNENKDIDIPNLQISVPVIKLKLYKRSEYKNYKI